MTSSIQSPPLNLTETAMSDDQNPGTSTATKPTGTTGELFLGGLVMAILSFLVVGGIVVAFNWIAGSGGPGFSECKARTRTMLIDPSSASFGPPSRAVSTENPKIIRLRYSVSATNAYGGRIESIFTCLVNDSGPERTVQVFGG